VTISLLLQPEMCNGKTLRMPLSLQKIQHNPLSLDIFLYDKETQNIRKMQEDCKPRGYQTVRLVTDAERCA
jgi:hypothetical protein